MNYVENTFCLNGFIVSHAVVNRQKQTKKTPQPQSDYLGVSLDSRNTNWYEGIKWMESRVQYVTEAWLTKQIEVYNQNMI